VRRNPDHGFARHIDGGQNAEKEETPPVISIVFITEKGQPSAIPFVNMFCKKKNSLTAVFRIVIFY